MLKIMNVAQACSQRSFTTGEGRLGLFKEIQNFWKSGEKDRHKEFQLWAEFENRGFKKPEYMDCWIIEKYGAPKDVLKKDIINVNYEKFASVDARNARIRQALTKPNEILVKVHAASLNPIDVAMCHGYGKNLINFRRNMYLEPISQFFKVEHYSEFPLVLGRDFSGTVVDVGSGIFDIVPGDEVYGSQELHRSGTLSDYVCVDLKCLCQKPNTLSHIEAAAIPYVAQTVLRAVGSFVKNPTGKRALLLGGAGGIGTFAIQYLKTKGVYVAVTCSNKSKALCTSLGADDCYDYTSDNHIEEILQQPKFDFVFDIVGAADPQMAADVLHAKGTYATLKSPLVKHTDNIGVLFGLSASVTTFLKSQFHSRGTNVKWVYFSPHREGLLEVAKLIDGGVIKPVIQKVINFQDVIHGFESISSGKSGGKVVVNVSGLPEANEKPNVDKIIHL